MIHLGVDPGLAGAIVALDDEARIVRAIPMPVLKTTKSRTEYDLVNIRALIEDSVYAVDSSPALPLPMLFVTVERSQPLPPGMGGGNAQFHRGVSRGLWEGLLTGLGRSYEMVAARSWQAVMLRDIPGSDPKQRALIAAQRLFPGHDFRASDRARKPHGGIVDAALIAEYGRRRRAGIEAA